jgi:general secretion pathway protein L
LSALLLLDLPLKQDEPVTWLHWDTERRCVLGDGVLDNMTALNELAEQFVGVACYGIVSGSAVSAHTVVLPKAGNIGMSALPYQLEDRLCCDLDVAHIAVGKLKANQPCDVLVISRELIQQYMAAIRASGLQIKALLPDYAVLGDNVLIADESRVAANLGGHRVGISSSNFAIWQQIVASDLLSIEGFQVYFIGDYRGPIAKLSVDDAVICGSRLEALARAFQAWPMSLLSGQYLIKDESTETFSRLRTPAILLVVLLLVYWLSLGVQIIRDNQTADRLDEAMVAVYQDTFPGARVVNARSQMRSQLNSLNAGGASSAMLPWLDKVAAASRGNTGISLSQLNYESDPAVMKLIVKAKSYETVDQWFASLKAQGLEVERGAFGQEEGAVVGQLSIRGAVQ